MGENALKVQAAKAPPGLRRLAWQATVVPGCHWGWHGPQAPAESQLIPRDPAAVEESAFVFDRHG